jgi:hypothetical protein
MTSPTPAFPASPSAKTAIAMTPIQSPRLEMHCALKNRRKLRFFRRVQ